MFDSSAEMADALTAVVDADTAALDADGLLDQLSTIQRLESVLAAKKAERMVAFHLVLSGPSADLGHEGPRPGDRPAGPAQRRWSADVLRSVSDEIGLALGAHRKTAASWLNRAAVLVDRFPVTLELLVRGGIPTAAAHHVAHELAVIADDELRAAVEQIVLAWGRRYGWRRIKKVANREAQKVLAEYESLLHAQRQDERATYTVSHDGGMADLVVSTSAIDITAIMAALTTRARDLQREGDPRNLDQLRTDLAVNRLLGHDQTAHNPAPAPAPEHGTSTATAASTSTGSAAGTGTGTGTASGQPHPESTSAPTADEQPRPEPASGHAGAARPGSEPARDHSGAQQPRDESVRRQATSGSQNRPADSPHGTAPETDSSKVETAPDAEFAALADAEPIKPGPIPGSPAESGLNPAVGVHVVIHCTYAEAEALATGAICTGGELEGYGILPQDALAMAFTRAKFRYRLTDRQPNSDPARYTPSAGLDQHVRDRDQRCRFPGCNARVEYCDLDHRVPFPKGRTNADNLEPFCRHHHRLKHHGDWQVYTTDTGTLVFISPTGRAYVEPPTMPDTTPGTGTREAESRPDAA